MANATELNKAAEESVNEFFSKSKESSLPEKKEKEANIQDIQEKATTKATKKSKPDSERFQTKKSIIKGEPKETKAKQVFSFRAAVEDIINWKAYATATGQTMEIIGTAAMKEYLTNHVLTGTEQTIFEAIKERDKNK